jgi:hypothetical protein
MKFKLFLVLSLILSLSSSFAHSDPIDEPVLLKTTSNHEIAFTFHKLAGTEPDYNSWVKSYLKDRMIGYGEQGQRHIVENTRKLFENHFKNFTPSKYSEIVLSLSARAEIVPFGERRMLNISLGQENIFIVRQTPEFNINIVVPGLEDKLSVMILEEDYKDITRASGNTFEKIVPITLLLRLRPVSVDAKKPLLIDSQEYWLLLANFITFEIWNDRGTSLFWKYISEEQREEKLRELRSLFKANETK